MSDPIIASNTGSVQAGGDGERGQRLNVIRAKVAGRLPSLTYDALKLTCSA